MRTRGPFWPPRFLPACFRRTPTADAAARLCSARSPGRSRRALRQRDRPAPGHVHRGGDRRRGLLRRPARGARARALRAARGRARAAPARLAGAAVPAAARAGRGQADSGPEWTPTLEGLGFAPRGLRRVHRRCCARCPSLLKGEEPRRLIEGLVDERRRPRTRRDRAAACTARCPSSPATPPSRPTSRCSATRWRGSSADLRRHGRPTSARTAGPS